MTPGEALAYIRAASRIARLERSALEAQLAALPESSLPHRCPRDGVVRSWEDLTPAWERDCYGLDGANCPGCGSTLCREAA